MMMLDVQESPLTHFVQEAERRRIARELHDNVVQSLTVLLADLEYFRTRRLQMSGGATPEVAQKLEVWQELARDSLLSMRETLGGLRRAQALEVDLLAAVESLALDLQRSGYTVTYECEDWPKNLPFEHSSNLYYSVREAITNIYKHAQASKVSIFLFSHEGSLHISIGDNGVGMTVPERVTGSEDGYHQGLLGIQERVALLGGRVVIESKPGRGTRLDIEVPWHDYE